MQLLKCVFFSTFFFQTHLTFGKEFAMAVEMKQVAQQEAERAKFLVEKVKLKICIITIIFSSINRGSLISKDLQRILSEKYTYKVKKELQKIQ